MQNSAQVQRDSSPKARPGVLCMFVDSANSWYRQQREKPNLCPYLCSLRSVGFLYQLPHLSKLIPADQHSQAQIPSSLKHRRRTEDLEMICALPFLRCKLESTGCSRLCAQQNLQWKRSLPQPMARGKPRNSSAVWVALAALLLLPVVLLSVSRCYLISWKIITLAAGWAKQNPSSTPSNPGPPLWSEL